MTAVSGAPPGWVTLLATAGWIVALIAGFVLAPSFLMETEREALKNLMIFGTAAIGILLVPLTRWIPRPAQLWWGVALALLGMSVYSLARYDTAFQQRTVRYDTSRVVAGNNYTEQARSYVERARRGGNELSREDVLLDFVGRVHQVWPVDEINANRELLIRRYVITVGLFAALVFVLSHVSGWQLTQARQGGTAD